MPSDPLTRKEPPSTPTLRSEEGIIKSTEDDPSRFLVQFDVGDPENPKNWSDAKRWYLTLIGAFLVFNATFASSAPSGVVSILMKEYDFSLEVGTLLIALFVAGYCVGPLLWAPLSESFGRRPVFIGTFFVYTCFQVGNALSNNVASFLVFRFLGGIFAAAPLTNSGALLSDIWDAKRRGMAMALFTCAPFSGPSLGPTVTGFIAVSGASWRWAFWVLAIFAGVCWILIILTVPETHAPTILVRKARRMRKETGDDRWYAPLERVNLTFAQRMETILAKPFKVMFQEPMLIAVTLYMSFVYGCVYLLFEAYPIVFSQGHHMSAGISGLMFLPVGLGGIASVMVYLIVFNPRYARAADAYAPHPVPPEVRLETAVVAAPLLTIGFFWFAWTSFPSVSFWAPMMAGGLLGFAILWIFLALMNYIVDTYLYIAASALASATVVRSLVGAAFPLFATQMYDRLGAQWASSLLGFISLALTPIPFVLMKYGPTLRARSKFVPSRVEVPPPQAADKDAEKAGASPV